MIICLFESGEEIGLGMVDYLDSNVIIVFYCEVCDQVFGVMKKCEWIVLMLVKQFCLILFLYEF